MTPVPINDVPLPLGAGVEAIYAGIDWLSCSLPHGAENRWRWVDQCRQVIMSIEKAGEKFEARTLNGYSGYSAGGSFYGHRDDGSYLQLSGHYASDFLDVVWRDDLSVSRVDCQATVRYRLDARGIGPQVYTDATDANETLSPKVRRRIWYMSGSDGGYTAYIGSVHSEHRARVYNKAIQSADPAYERCWRFEVVFRGDYAGPNTRRVQAAGHRRPQVCAGIVDAWLTLRGVRCEWARYIPVIAQPLLKEVPSDAEKKLKWLYEQVRPAYQWLVDSGRGEEAKAILLEGIKPKSIYDWAEPNEEDTSNA